MFSPAKPVFDPVANPQAIVLAGPMRFTMLTLMEEIILSSKMAQSA